MGKHARLGLVETEIEKLGEDGEWGFAAVDVDPDTKQTKVSFHYAGVRASLYDPGEQGGSETWVFNQEWKAEGEDPVGHIKHVLFRVLFNGIESPWTEVDEDFKEFVTKKVVPLLDAHFTRELY